MEIVPCSLGRPRLLLCSPKPNGLLVEGGTKLSAALADDSLGVRDEVLKGVDRGGGGRPGFGEGLGSFDAVFGVGLFAVVEGGFASRLTSQATKGEVREVRETDLGFDRGEDVDCRRTR
jgi:hypothetical protein